MKQKFNTIRSWRLRWRVLLIVLVLAGIAAAIPTVVRAACLPGTSICDQWWGSVTGDNNQDTRNYIIHPPADDKPPGNSTIDGVRLQFIIHKWNDSQGGTTAAYLPHQYLVASTQPKLTFEMRGGYWDKSGCPVSDDGGTCADGSPRDRYDRSPANPAWTTEYTKSLGYLSPFYYEVYQLTNADPLNGRLLGILNPRDPSIFPTTDNNPNNNTDCNYVTVNAKGPCWRTFNVDGNGGAITTDGAQQDSCAKRKANHNNQCYSRSPIAYGEGGPNARTLAAAGNEIKNGPEIWETRPELLNLTETALAVAQRDAPSVASTPKRDALADLSKEARELALGQAANAADPPTHPVHGFVSPNNKASGHVDISVQSGNNGQCRDAQTHFVDKVTKPFYGSTVDFACKDGFNYTVSVAPQDFTYDLGGLDTGNCHIGSNDQAVAVGSGEATANFTYNCRHQIRVTVNPVARTGGHVRVELTGGSCAGGNFEWVKDNPGVWDDGTALFTQCEDANYTAHIRTNEFYDDQGNYHCERVENNGNYPDSQNFGNTQTPSNLKYRCFEAIASDGGPQGSENVAFDSSRFAGVLDQRFDTSPQAASTQPNLNGHYVFLIKPVAYSDVGHGYVSDIARLLFTDQLNYEGSNIDYSKGCPLPGSGNRIQCPNGLLSESGHHANDHLVQNGFYIRSPRDVDGNANTRTYLSSAPTKWAFNFSYGPTSPNAGGERSFNALRFQAGGTACRSLYKLRIPNADWDNATQYASGGSFDYGLGASVDRIGTSDDRGNFYYTGNDSKQVSGSNLSGDWTSNTSTGLFYSQIQINDPGFANPSSDYWPSGYPNTIQDPYFPVGWQTNEHFTGQLGITGWDDGNNLSIGGLPFTWGFWPTCEQPNPALIQLQTPKNGYTYDGNNSDNAVNADGVGGPDYVDGYLNFRFTYPLGEFRPQVRYKIEFTGPDNIAARGQERTVYDVSAGTNSGDFAVQVGDLRPDTSYSWRACVTTVNDWSISSCSDYWSFKVNKGPSAAIVSGNSYVPNTNTQYPGTDRPNKGVYFKCSQLGSRLTDPESAPHQVRPYYRISWNDKGQLNTVDTYTRQGTSDDNSWSNWRSPNYGYKDDGSSFTSDEVSPRLWRAGSSLKSLTAAERSMSMTQFLQERVPDGVDISWEARGEDRFGAADLNNSLPLPLTLYNNSSPFTAGGNNAGPAFDQQTPLSNRRFGLPTPEAFHKNTAPNFNTASTKKFKDLAGNTITSVTDGQTVQVETKMVNGGETPTKFYELRDYLGALRDFETPTDITIRKNDGTTITLPADQVLTKVVPDRVNGNDTQLPDEVDPESADYLRGSWRIDLGSNQNGPLADPAIGGAGNVLNPGDSITLTYQVRANRNQRLLNDSANNEFSHRLFPTDIHFWANYQENYCDDNDRKGVSVDQLPGTVAAPWLRAHRGSVASNGGIFGYDSLAGQANATFLVQANGALSHFFGGAGNISDYTSQQAVCTPESGLPNTGERPGGVDWRRTMITNIGKLLDGSYHSTSETTSTFNSGSGQVTLNPGGGANVWVAGSSDNRTGLTISNSEAFKGVGTLVVFGDLNIGPNVSLTYEDDDGSINSLGVIVIGNLNIDPSVTNLVGNYYVLDSDPALDDEGCPIGIDPAKTTRGRVNTGSSANRLNVQGLIVAGAFDLLRYYVDPTDSAADPAENIYYDGRVLANTPPGFGTFRNTASWQEIAP